MKTKTPKSKAKTPDDLTHAELLALLRLTK